MISDNLLIKFPVRVIINLISHSLFHSFILLVFCRVRAVALWNMKCDNVYSPCFEDVNLLVGEIGNK